MSKALLIAVFFGFSSMLGAAQAAPDQVPALSLESLRAKYAEPAGHIADIGGVDLYYKDEGKGPVLLMIHGSVNSLRAYDRVAEKLTGKYRVIRYDIPPFGLSGPISDAAAAQLKPADIPEQLLGKLGVKTTTVVAFSSGGVTAAALAAKRPDLVRRLILANVPSDPVDTSHINPAMAMNNGHNEYRSLPSWREFLDYFSGVPGRISPGTVEQIYDMNRRAPERNSQSLLSLTTDHKRTVEIFGGVVAPTLLIWGERDALLTPPTADALAGYLTHAQVSKMLLPDVGHYPPIEVPDRFAAIVADFIENVTPIETRAP